MVFTRCNAMLLSLSSLYVIRSPLFSLFALGAESKVVVVVAVVVMVVMVVVFSFLQRI